MSLSIKVVYSLVALGCGCSPRPLQVAHLAELLPPIAARLPAELAHIIEVLIAGQEAGHLPIRIILLVPGVLNVFQLSVGGEPLPQPGFFGNLDLERGPTCLEVVGVLVRDVHGGLDLDQGPKLAVVVSEVVVAVCALLNERMDTTHADVGHSEVVVCPATDAHGCQLLVAKCVLVEVDDMKILLPSLRLVLLGKG